MTQQVETVQVDELVREIARALVDEPDAVEVESVNREENTVLKLRVAAQDVGKVIGKQGRTARSVRTILGAVSMKLHHRYTLDILEEEDEAQPHCRSRRKSRSGRFRLTLGATPSGAAGPACAHSPHPGPQGRSLRRHPHRFS
jgi:uncharacterized protein